MPDDAVLPAGSPQLLGHDDYAAWVTAEGVGTCRWKGLAVTRWRTGPDGGGPGDRIYVRDPEDGSFWLAGAGNAAARAWREPSMLRCARRDGDVTTTLEVAIDPELAVAVRGVGLRNDGLVGRDIELTSCAELVLGPEQADASHPAYSKMFVQTDIVDGVLLAWRRKKEPSDPDIWAAHALVVDGEESGSREWTTDRAGFIGRDASLAAPLALQRGQRLTALAGTVLDPVFSLRTRLHVAADETRRAAFVTVVATSRVEALDLIRRHRTPSACAGVFDRARAGAVESLRKLGINATAARRFQCLSGALLGRDRTWRADMARVARGDGGAPVLWARGISGDLPIVLVQVGDTGGIGLVREILDAQRWWRTLQLPVDVVVLDAAGGAAGKSLADIAGGHGDADKSRGSLFVLQDADIDDRLRNGLFAAACVVLDTRNGGLAAQIARHPGERTPAGSMQVAGPSRARGGKPAALPAHAALAFWNGYGGFAADGAEYVTIQRDDIHTPAPWSHVVANPGFGFLATTTGGGYTWAVNSQQNPITPWLNDVVRDPCGEAFLLRDLDDGIVWSATASPIRAGGATYVSRFGPGYARFDANVHGIETELVQCVAADDPVKFSRLRLRNGSGRPRRIAVALAVEWMLGPIGSDPRATTQVEADPGRGAVFARNAWRDTFAPATAFVACSAENTAVGSTDDPRSAAVALLELAPGATAELLFLLGEGGDAQAARALVDRHRRADFDGVLKEAQAVWDSVLQPLQVETPQRSIDLLVNRCLPYQVLACRVWARTAFYQASGAFGFRDQLQDVGALCIARPDLARQHILLSASRQFEEGDVQHWWLPPSGKGVRTRMVDDRLWLPLIAAHYVRTTGDAAVLAEKVPFLRGDALKPGQTDAFFAPAKSPESATLFEHCARAIDASLATGVHGLPLIGTGDWNDGFNRIGAGGKGESVWMGWFLAKVIADFAPFAEARGDPRAARWHDHARALELALETKAWDGAWYRRAFYDDGTPLGTSVDTECRIESMAQSWAVISGIGDPERAARAMRAVNEHLVRRNDGLVALFSEPFDRTLRDPGYIKGYPPGLRENGGQYTHGSIWSLIAFAMLGDGDKAGELLEIFDPLRKSDSRDKADHYMVEPYVQCADVYSVAPHVGRGGWTWYSGSAAWTYRAIVEWVLGFRLYGERLHLEPCIPRGWKGFSLHCRRGGSVWHVEVENPDHVCRGSTSIQVDGVTLTDSRAGIALIDDGADHHVRVTLHEEPHR